MQTPNFLKTLSQMEITLLVIFVIYLVFPIQMPDLIAGAIDAPLGMLSIFIITVYLFFNANPILAVIYIFVAYEMLRRSSQSRGRTVVVKYTPSQIKKDAQMVAMNPIQKETLEEEMVDKMAPIGHSDMSIYTASEYKPVAESVGTASMY